MSKYFLVDFSEIRDIVVFGKRIGWGLIPFLISSFLLITLLVVVAQEKPLPSIPIEEVGTNSLITTVHTGFKIGENISRANLLKEDWTPTKIEREWILPNVIRKNRWTITEDSPRWVEVIVIVDNKLKLKEKRLSTKIVKTVEF